MVQARRALPSERTQASVKMVSLGQMPHICQRSLPEIQLCLKQSRAGTENRVCRHWMMTIETQTQLEAEELRDSFSGIVPMSVDRCMPTSNPFEYAVTHDQTLQLVPRLPLLLLCATRIAYSVL